MKAFILSTEEWAIVITAFVIVVLSIGSLLHWLKTEIDLRYAKKLPNLRMGRK